MKTGIFHLLFLDCGHLKVAETVEGETAGGRGPDLRCWAPHAPSGDQGSESDLETLEVVP